MKWKEGYLDMILVPLGLILCIFYHIWLWQRVKSQPQTTDIGIYSSAQRLWVVSMMKDNGKKFILVVQTIRNVIMASTLMATTSILLCTGLAAIISSTYSVKKPLEGSLYGAHGGFVMAVKYVAMLFVFLLAFICYTLSISLMNQVSFFVNIPSDDEDYDNDKLPAVSVTVDYVCNLFDKGYLLHVAGNRLFYAGTPLLLWIFGPSLVFLCYLLLVPLMYKTDIVRSEAKGECLGQIAEEKHAHVSSRQEVA